jgi:carboxyl-terminal processing protease
MLVPSRVPEVATGFHPIRDNDTPAAKAGVMANDIIIKLDDEQVHGLTLNQAVEKMRGSVNTKIKLTIMRKGQDKPIDVSIVRDVIRVKSVRSHTEGDDVGYIRVTQFNEQTTEALKKAISDLTSQLGAYKIKGSSSICATIQSACSIRRFRSRTRSLTRAK